MRILIKYEMYTKISKLYKLLYNINLYTHPFVWYNRLSGLFFIRIIGGTIMEQSLFRYGTRSLGLLAVISLVYIMAAITFWWDDVFVDMEHISIPEYGILFGFVIVGFFLVLSFVQHMFSMITSEFNRVDAWDLCFTILCLLALMVEKVMVDEIAREYNAGLPIAGEWVILYGMLLFQLMYSLSYVARDDLMIDGEDPSSLHHITP